MIAKLTGVVDSVASDTAIIDVAGVGYQVFASRRTLGLLQAGQPATVLVEMHVREDHIHLYGFADRSERDWYRLLTTVQGVGGRVALAILSVLAPEQLTAAVAAQDRAAISRADGVGPKLAGRIASELRDKVDAIALGPVGAPPSADRPAAEDGAVADAVSALVNLGYGRSEAYAAVATAAGKLGDTADVAALVPAALKALAQ